MIRVKAILLFLLGCAYLSAQDNCNNYIEEPIPNCSCDDCGFIEPLWNLVNEQSSVCEGLPFEVSGGASHPLEDIETFHWYFIEPTTNAVLYDELHFDTTYVEYTHNVTTDVACDETSVLLTILLVITSADCDDGESCRIKSTSVSVNLLPEANFNVPEESCITMPVVFSNESCHGETYLWDFGDGQTSTLLAPSHMYNTPGEYDVTLTVMNECGEDTHTETIEIIGPPVANASFVLDPMTGCSPLDVLFTNQSEQIDEDAPNDIIWSIVPATGWDFLDTIYDENTWNNGIIFYSSGMYTVTLTVSNICEMDTWTETIEVLQAPTANLDSPENACISSPGQSIPIDFTNLLTTTGSTCGFDWTITNEDTGEDWTSTMQFPNFNFDEPGEYTVDLVIDGCECGDLTETTTFYIQTPEDLSFEVPNEPLCSNAAPFQLEASPEGGTWSGSSAVTNEGIFNPAIANIGANMLTYTVGSGACQSSGNVTIEVVLAPSISIQTVVPVCDELNFMPNLSISGEYEEETWTLILEDGTEDDIAPNTASILINQSGTHQFIVELESNCGTVADTITLEIQSIDPIMITEPTAPWCSTSSPAMIEVSPEGGTWTGTGISSDGIFDPAIPMPGTTVTLTYSYGEGVCSESETIQVEVLASEAVDVETDVTLCTDSAPYTLTFSPDSGTWTGEGISPEGIFDPSGLAIGMYEATYLYGDANGCEITQTSQIEIEGLPTIELDEQITFCETSEDISLPNTLATYIFSPNTGTATWSGTGIVDAANGLFNSLEAGATGVGNYTVYVHYMLVDCEIMDSLEIEIVPLQAAEAGANDTLCISDETYTLVGTPAGGQWTGNAVNPTTGEIDLTALIGGGQFSYTYTLSPNTSCETNDMVVIEVIDLSSVDAGNDIGFCADAGIIQLPTASPSGGYWEGMALIDSQNGSVDISQLMPGDYTFSYHIESAEVDCASQDDLILTVHPLPIPAFSLDSLACLDIPISFSNNSTGATSYNWNFGDNSPLNTQIAPSHTYNTPGGYTVNLQATTAFGCQADYSEIVHITAPPEFVGFDLSTDEGCSDLSVTITNTSIGENINYTWDLGNGQTSTDLNPGTVVYTQGQSDTIYYLHLSIANGCGDESKLDSILVHPQPISVLGTDFDVYCSGDTTYIANASYGDPDTYIWDYGNGMTTTDSMPQPQVYFTDSIPQLIQLSLITENECGIDTASYEITINPSDVEAFFNTDPPEVCAGDTIFLTSYATLNATIIWQFDDGNSTADIHPTHVFEEPGLHEITQYVQGCGFDSMTQQINVLPIPTANFIYETIECLYDTVTFTNTSVDAVGYEWLFGDGNSSNLEHPEHIYTLAGNYPVSLIVTAENGCTHEQILPVEILAPPLAVALLPDTICATQLVEMESNSVGDIASCYWDLGDGNNQSDCQISHTYSNAGDYIITLIATDNFGCRDTSESLIYARPTPTADFDFIILNNCNPAEVLFTNQSSAANSYSWQLEGTTTSIEENPTHLYLNGGNYNVILTAAYDGLCFDEITQPVLIQPTPTAIIAPDPIDGCAEYTVNFESQSLGTITVQEWNFGDMITSFEENPTHTYQQPGTYEITLIVETEHCADTTNSIAEIFVPVTADTILTHVLCHGDETGSIDLTILTGTAPYEFDWTTDEETEDISELAANDYAVTITDSNDCQWVANMTITQPTPLETSLVEEGIVSCFGGDDGYLVIETNGGESAYTYLWVTGDTTVEIVNYPAGNYNLTVTDANDCIWEGAFELHENTPIEWQPNIEHISCFGANDGFIGIESIAGGVPPYYSALSNDTLDEAGGSFPNLLPSDYYLFISDANSCEFYDTVQIIEPSEIWINILAKGKTILLGDEVDLITEYNGANPIFEWSPPRWLDCTDCPDPIAQPFEDVLYEVRMTDENNCSVTDTIHLGIDVKRSVFVPEGFTPNDDGINDKFTIRSGDKSIKRIHEFNIYDRWGELMYSAEDFSPNDTTYGWDGTFRGKELAPAVFTWYAKIEFVDNITKVYSGDITLIK